MKKYNIQGFSMLEMVLTLVVISILASIALPSLQKFISENRIETVSNRMEAALIYARSEAITRGFPVSLCVSNPSQTLCDTSKDDYAAGWMVFTDYNGNGVYEPAVTADTTGDGVDDASELILQVSGDVSDKLAIKNAGLLEDSITYNDMGKVNVAVAAPNDRFYLNKDGKSYKNLIITAIGRVKSCKVKTPSVDATCS